MKLDTYVKDILMYLGCSESLHTVEMLVNNWPGIFG
jgi:hypothetical protein